MNWSLIRSGPSINQSLSAGLISTALIVMCHCRNSTVATPYINKELCSKLEPE